MGADQDATGPFVTGGVDTHKDLHVAAVVDAHDRGLVHHSDSATTRHGYKQLLAWMRSFGQVRRVGVEATGTYGAGLLRYLRKAGVEVRPGRLTLTVGCRAGRDRSAFRDGSSTVPFEQIGQSAVKRLWRQKSDDI